MQESHANVAYFPSYEIITGAFNKGRYFADDLRNANEDGVNHVMRLFLKHATDFDPGYIPPTKASAEQSFVDRMMQVVQTTCEEELIETSLSRPT